MMADDPQEPYGSHAAEYLAAGWFPFPLPPRAKQPPPVGWTGREGGYPSAADVAAWAQERPSGNIGLHMAENQLDLDVDAYNKGLEAIAACEQMWGPLPDGPSFTSRSDGSAHRLFRLPDWARELAWPGELPGGGVDIIQAGHRYAMAPPSIHPSGREVRWASEDQRVPKPEECPELPREWIEGLTQMRPAPRRSVLRHLSHAGADEWVAARGGLLCRRLADLTASHLERMPSTPGGRHHWMQRAVWSLIAAAAEEPHTGLPTALELIHEPWERIIEGDSPRAEEFHRAVWTAIAKMPEEPPDAPHGCVTRPYVPPPGSVKQPFTAGERPKRPLIPRMYSRAELAELPEPEPLIADTIDQRTLAMLFGPPGSLKSFVALDWLCSVATGLPWLGRSVMSGRAVLVAAEGVHGVHRRVGAWEELRGQQVKDLDVFAGAVHLGDEAQVGELAEAVDGALLMVLDTYARSIPGLDENTSKDTGVAVESLYRLREAMDAAGSVIVVHHAARAGNSRGSSALEAALDTIYSAEGDAGGATLTRVKRKDGPVEDVVHGKLRLAGASGAFEGVNPKLANQADALLVAFVEHFAQTGASKAELRLVADLPPATFHRSLGSLLRLAILENSGTEQRPFYRFGPGYRP